jgi:hypothetical protein
VTLTAPQRQRLSLGHPIELLAREQESEEGICESHPRAKRPGCLPRAVSRVGTHGQASEQGIGTADEAVDSLHARTPVRIPVAQFEIGTIVSYQGRLYVVLGVTPMSVTPALLELEDTENGSTRRVRADNPKLVVGVTKRPPADDA